MSLAPEAILKAGNDTVSWTCVFCRNQTLREGVSIKMINGLMEAVHEIPRMLTDWEHHDLAEMRLHLACFPATKWPGAPDLVVFFDQKLRDHGYNEHAEEN